EMRGEIRHLVKSLGMTTIYVTHDQEEALAISDRIAVMRAGRLEQVAAPAEIYRRPASAFVAEFMGTTNLYSGRVLRDEAGCTIVAVGREECAIAGPGGGMGESLGCATRPEARRLATGGAPAPDGWSRIEARLARIELLGALTRLEAVLADGLTLRVALL